MRFLDNGPEVPRELVIAQEKGETIFVCGAGVSRTVGLPLFSELVEAIYQRLGEDWHHHPAEGEAMQARQYDRVLRCLERRLAASDAPRHRSMRERIRSAVAAALAQPDDAELADHAALLALSRDVEGRIRLLTTNFDTLFERAWLLAHGVQILSHAGVALPQPRTTNAMGVLHLHGRQFDERLGLPQTDIVLTSAEFGDAYLRTGWASRYVYDLARVETLVFVGYQADDPPMRYLLEALEADRSRFPDLRKVYAFGGCAPGAEADVRAQWESKGVEPILYQVEAGNHGALYATLREWRSYADDPTAWRRERLRERLEIDGAEPTESQVVSCLPYLDRGDALQLLTDLSPAAAWLPALLQRGVFPDGTLPSGWIAGRINDPEMIQVCAGLVKIDRATAWIIDRELDRDRGTLSPVRSRAWRLLLAGKGGRSPGEAAGCDWHARKRSIQEGQSDFPSRDVVVDCLRPRLTIGKPIRWPSANEVEAEETLHGLLRFDFEPLDHPRPAEILALWPDTPEANAGLLRVLDRALDDALERACDLGLLGSWDAASWDVPSVATHPQNQHRRGFYPITRAIADLWLRVARDAPVQARAFASRWLHSPYLLSRRIGLFALASDLHSAQEAAEAVLALNDLIFWVGGAQVEVMRLLTLRWMEFDAADRAALEQRIRSGVPRDLFNEDAFDGDQWQSVLDSSIHRRLTRLVATGGVLTSEGEQVLSEIQERHREWEPNPGDRDDFPSWHETRSEPDERPGDLASIPDDQLVHEAFRLQAERRFSTGDLWYAFCKADLPRALRGLVAAGVAGQWHPQAWDRLLWAIVQREESDELHRTLAGQLVEMPIATLAALQDSAAAWFEAKWSVLSEAGQVGATFYAVWDRLADIAYAAPNADQVREVGADLMSDAVSRAGGILASLLVAALSGTRPAGSAGLPADLAPRFDLVTSAVGYPGLLGRSQLFRQLAFLENVAPDWTAKHLLPLLDWAHAEARAMWEGYAGGNIGSVRLFTAVKPHLLSAFHHKGLSDDDLESLFDRLLQVALWHAWGQAPEYELSFPEVRHALAISPPAVRRHVSWRLWRIMAEENEQDSDKSSRWRARLAPVFGGIWPLDAHARDPDSSQHLALMALECGDAFPEAVEMISGVLVPYELHQIAYGLRLEAQHDTLVTRFPQAFVRLVNALVDPDLCPVPPDLTDLLRTCVEADPDVAQDPAYIRLYGLRRLLNA